MALGLINQNFPSGSRLKITVRNYFFPITNGTWDWQFVYCFCLAVSWEIEIIT